MKLQATKEINLDVSKHKYISLDAKQYDRNLRFILITCYRDGELLPINKNTCFASIRYRKPDEYGVFNHCEITADGKILVELTEQMLAVAGICYADVVIHENVELSVNIVENTDNTVEIIDTGDSGIISTMTFIVYVHESAFDNEEVESSYEYNVLNDLLIESRRNYTEVIESCRESERNAKKSEINASMHEKNSNKHEVNAREAQVAAKAHREAALTSENNALNSANLAQSYAVGGTNLRENEDIDNARYYYEQSKTNADISIIKADEAKISENKAEGYAANLQQSMESAADSAASASNNAENAEYYYNEIMTVKESLDGAYVPMGTITFAELLTLKNNGVAKTGYLYNVSDSFVTDEAFKIGAGVEYPEGTNVYLTGDGYWDCLVGATASVTGVKGTKETNYRQGNVNIAPTNIGAIPTTDIATIDEVQYWLGLGVNVVPKPQYPTLSDEQKAQLKNLATAYRRLNLSYNDGKDNEKATFMYHGNTTRNSYANSSSWIDAGEFSAFGLCCNTFVEMVWMGRSPEDFKDKDNNTYSNKITFWEDEYGTFDWGYYPEFKQRKIMSGLALVEKDKNGNVVYDEFGIPTITDYYNFINPNPKTDDVTQQKYEYSYSSNSYYDPDVKTTLNKQWFASFMTQADLAYELYRNGYSIPFEELDEGDLIFTAPSGYNLGDEHKTFINDMYWRNIGHVSMVYRKDEETGNLTIIECTDSVNEITTPIVCSSLNTNNMWDKVRYETLLKNTVMCARHPAAWGKSNIEDAYRKSGVLYNNIAIYKNDGYYIEYLPMAMQHGYKNNPIIIKPNQDGTMPKTNIKKDVYYMFNNKIAQSGATHMGADAFNGNFFVNIK